MFKRIIVLSIIFVLLTSVLVPISIAANQFELAVLLNGKKIAFPDEKPRIDENNRVLIPVRFVSEALGAKVDYANNVVTISQDERVIVLTIGSNIAIVEGADVTFDTQAIVTNGRTLVPLRFVSEALGQKVEWDAANRFVWIGEKDIPLMEDVARTATFDEFRDMYGDATYLTDDFEEYEDIQVFSQPNLPIRLVGEFTDTVIYKIWKDEHEGRPVIKVHYAGRHFDIYFLTDDQIPRYRTNMEAWRVTNEDGSFVGVFDLITPSDGYRRDVPDWEDFQYSDIRYISFTIGTYSLPMFDYSHS